MTMQAVQPPQQEAEHHQHHRLQRQRAQRGLGRILEQQPGDRRGHRAGGELEPGAARGGAHRRRRGERVARQRGPVPPERHQQRQQRSPVQGDIEGQAGVRPAEQLRHDVQMGAARHGKELGEALDRAEDERLHRMHGGAR
jgi:hypothetical protein